MNTVNLYSIHDRKTGVFSSPICFPHIEDARRNFALMLKNNPKSLHACYPEDYDIVFVGQMNLDTGVVDANTSPVLAFSLSELVSPQEQ